MSNHDFKQARETWVHFEAQNPVLKVAHQRCKECLFTINRIVSEQRLVEILDECARKNTHFTCHFATLRGEDVVCAGFFENHTSTKIELMQALNRIELVDVTSGNALKPK